MGTENKTDLLFTARHNDVKKSQTSLLPDNPDWKIMIIDDEQDVHDISEMVLKNFSYKNRGIEFVHGYSGKEACELIKQHPDTAVMLLDVVMESDTAGLDTVNYIREILGNKTVRIILRTGQPGQAPQLNVVRIYDINDYLEKSKLTSQYLEVTLITSLRSYDDICTISQLNADNDSLESIINIRTRDLALTNKMLIKQMKEQIFAHKELQKSEEQLSEAQRIARIGHFTWLFEENQISWSKQIDVIFDITSPSDSYSLNEFLNLIDLDYRELVEKTMRQSATNQEPYTIEYQLKTKSNTKRHVRQQGCISKHNAHNMDNTISIIGTIQDITEQHNAVTKMRKLSTAVEQIADGILITDHNGIIEYVNPATTQITGYSKNELLGQTPSILKSNKQSDAFYYRLWKIILQGKVFNEVIINKRKNGQLYYEEKMITPQKNNKGEIISFISSGKDITERMEAQERLSHLAHHDALTGLPNRVLFQDRLEQAISRALWRERKLAVFFLDLDRFKVINDTLGHDTGDMLLEKVSQRLFGCLREGDTVARLGGDEFAIILNDIASIDDIMPMANKLLSSLISPFNCLNQELFVTASIGISVFPDDGANGQTLLKKADTAMYSAKNKGKNGFEFYSTQDEQKAIKRLSLESNLRRALERNEFLLYFQPQLSLYTCTVESYEVLIRWQHPTQGIISPINFIPLLEETGMIIDIGEWVLRTACSEEKKNQQLGYKPRKVTVNISIIQFKQKTFVDMVSDILRSTELDTQYLELELTEGVMIDDIIETEIKLQQLHKMGVSLAIDDFGTGYSSMNYLKRLPFDILKIDKSFIDEVINNDEDAAIVASIHTLAHSIGLEIVAEGVETEKQLSFLVKLGCDKIQGYLCSPPSPFTEFKLLEDDSYKPLKYLLNHSDN